MSERSLSKTKIPSAIKGTSSKKELCRKSNQKKGDSKIPVLEKSRRIEKVTFDESDFVSDEYDTLSISSSIKSYQTYVSLIPKSNKRTKYNPFESSPSGLPNSADVPGSSVSSGKFASTASSKVSSTASSYHNLVDQQIRNVLALKNKKSVNPTQIEFKTEFLDPMKNFPEEKSSDVFINYDKNKLWNILSSHSFAGSDEVAGRSYFDKDYDYFDHKDIKVYTNPITNVTHLIARNAKLAHPAKVPITQTASKFIIHLEKVLQKPPKEKLHVMKKQNTPVLKNPNVSFASSQTYNNKNYKGSSSNLPDEKKSVYNFSIKKNSVVWSKLSKPLENNLESNSRISPSKSIQSHISPLIFDYVNPRTQIESTRFITDPVASIKKSKKFTQVVPDPILSTSDLSLQSKDGFTQLIDPKIQTVSVQAARLHPEITKQALIGTPLHIISGIAILPDSSTVYIRHGVCGSCNLHSILREQGRNKSKGSKNDKNKGKRRDPSLIEWLGPKVVEFVKGVISCSIWLMPVITIISSIEIKGSAIIEDSSRTFLAGWDKVEEYKKPEMVDESVATDIVIFVPPKIDSGHCGKRNLEVRKRRFVGRKAWVKRTQRKTILWRRKMQKGISRCLELKTKQSSLERLKKSKILVEFTVQNKTKIYDCDPEASIMEELGVEADRIIKLKKSISNNLKIVSSSIRVYQTLGMDYNNLLDKQNHLLHLKSKVEARFHELEKKNLRMTEMGDLGIPKPRPFDVKIKDLFLYF